MWAKIKSFLPGFDFLVKSLIAYVFIKALVSLIGGVFAAAIEDPVGTAKSYIPAK